MLTLVTGEDPRWAALLKRDPRADRSFVYAVRTTGIYCRPTCAAKLARRENVRYFDTHADAEAAGFRACKRCFPNAASPGKQRTDAIAAACRFIEAAEEPPSLQALAERAGLSPFHFQRVFKKVTGVTPKQYATAKRAHRVQKGLQQSTTVTEAVYAAGYNSSSRFYGNNSLGMTPTAYRRGAAGEVIHYATGQCSLGSILVARSERGVCAILLGDDDLRARFPNATLVPDDGRALAEVIRHVDRPGNPHLPLDIRGTAFQQRVWEALQQIPAGKTATYAQIAERIGKPTSVRAVASACAANPVAVVIPCHRVVRSDGELAGYRWGLERKRELLKRERET